MIIVIKWRKAVAKAPKQCHQSAKCHPTHFALHKNIGRLKSDRNPTNCLNKFTQPWWMIMDRFHARLPMIWCRLNWPQIPPMRFLWKLGNGSHKISNPHIYSNVFPNILFWPKDPPRKLTRPNKCRWMQKGHVQLLNHKVEHVESWSHLKPFLCRRSGSVTADFRNSWDWNNLSDLEFQ